VDAIPSGFKMASRTRSSYVEPDRLETISPSKRKPRFEYLLAESGGMTTRTRFRCSSVSSSGG
jgi:hypothetical protein